MQNHLLGSSGLSVSHICLGTMTWGTQNSQQDANQQIEFALDHGINFIDTAEMYSIPPTPESYCKTETYIGNWIAANHARRSKFILATKIAGRGVPHIRDGERINGANVKQSIDASLRRLQTDYIDLFQIHWPNRPTPHFGRHKIGGFKFKSNATESLTEDIHEQLNALNDGIKAGKIRHYGLSNETPWGIKAWLELSKEHNLPRPASVQNEFNLLQTMDWPHMIEICNMENIAYLPWSPLAAGLLSGKYANNAIPKGSRWSYSQRNGLFRNTPASHEAVAAYSEIAEKHGISTAQLALRWCASVPGVTSTIIGATSLEQLKENIQAFDLNFSEALAKETSEVLQKYAMPF